MSRLNRRGAYQLDLPRPQEAVAAAGPIVRRARGRRRRRQRRLRQGAMGVMLAALGTGILAALVRIPERLDALLLVSNAVANVIGGLSRLSLGLLQLGGVLAVVVLALFAVLLLAGGIVRLWRALLAAEAPASPGVAAQASATRRVAVQRAGPSPPPQL